MSDDTIPMLRPGETIGPFEIVIPREILFLVEYRRKTTRRERLLIRMGLMRRTRRRALFARFRPWFDEHGWEIP